MAYPSSEPQVSLTFEPLSHAAIVPFASTETGWKLDTAGGRAVRRSVAGVEVPFTPTFKVSLEASRSEGYDGFTQHYRFGDVTWIKSKKALMRFTVTW